MTYSLKFTSSSWTYSVNGTTASYGTWKYVNGYIYLYMDGYSVGTITVISSTQLNYQDFIFTKS